MAETNCNDKNGNIESPEEGLKSIQSNHDEAYLNISQAISYEEQNRYELARNMYIRGLEKIDKALDVRCDRPYCVGTDWDKARQMQQKMRKTIQMVKVRLNKSNQPTKSTVVKPDTPPSYSEACQHELNSAARRASCPVNSKEGLEGLGETTGASENCDPEIEVLFSIPEGVQLFFVSSDGTVSTSSTSSSLNIYKFIEINTQIVNGTTLPSAWLQVGSWTYPLVPGQSPALESGYGAFIFPDLGSEQDSSAVGIILPSSVDPERRHTFELILDNLTVFEEERQKLAPKCVETFTSAAVPSFSDRLSWGIVTGSEYLSAGLVKGASVTGQYIQKGVNKLKERLNPDEQPTSVDPGVKEAIKVVKGVSCVALKVSEALVTKLSELTIALGNKAAPHIREYGAKILTNGFNYDPAEAKEKMDNLLKVAAGGVQGFSNVYHGLEGAAKILAVSLSTGAVTIVDHKYGPEAGEVVGNAVSAVGDLALTTRNVHTLGVKSIAKRTAKDAGKAVLKDYIDKDNPKHNGAGPSSQQEP